MITIYHNPNCGTSRTVLGLIESAGYVPEVIDYRASGWTRELLGELLAGMGKSPRDIMREKGTPAVDLGLLEPAATDEQIISAMIEHPILVNRPIVRTPRGTKLCRPSDEVLSLLERKPEESTKEDGATVRG